MRHSNQVLKYFFETDHAGKLDKQAVNFLYGELGSMEQGYILRLYLCCQQGKIKEARFQAYGSVIVIAATEYICRWIEGKTVGAARELQAKQIQQALGLSTLEMHAAILVENLISKTCRTC